MKIEHIEHIRLEIVILCLKQNKMMPTSIGRYLDISEQTVPPVSVKVCQSI